MTFWFLNIVWSQKCLLCLFRRGVELSGVKLPYSVLPVIKWECLALGETPFPVWSPGQVNSGFHPLLPGAAEALFAALSVSSQPGNLGITQDQLDKRTPEGHHILAPAQGHRCLTVF